MAVHEWGMGEEEMGRRGWVTERETDTEEGGQQSTQQGRSLAGPPAGAGWGVGGAVKKNWLRGQMRASMSPLKA